MLAPVPLVMTPLVRQWRCHMRGACCKVHRIQVDAGEQRRIAKALRAANDPRAEVMERPLPTTSDVEHLPMTAEDHCIFLSADNRCELRRFGPRVYPSICQKFPYLSILTPERHIISLTLQCPTALALFAKEETFELVFEPEDSEPPTEHLIYIGGDEQEYVLGDGTKTDGLTFWRTHWDWFERLRARTEHNAIERLTRFAEEVTGEEAPSCAMLTGQQWVQAAFDPSVPRQLERLTGAKPAALAWLWLNLERENLGPLPKTTSDDHALLNRYLLHRFQLPVSYINQTDLRLHLATLFAMVTRYRIERARGHEPILAMRQLDRLFVHVGGIGSALRIHNGEPAWQPFCALANAVTV